MNENNELLGKKKPPGLDSEVFCLYINYNVTEIWKVIVDLIKYV